MPKSHGAQERCHWIQGAHLCGKAEATAFVARHSISLQHTKFQRVLLWREVFASLLADLKFKLHLSSVMTELLLTVLLPALLQQPKLSNGIGEPVDEREINCTDGRSSSGVSSSGVSYRIAQ